eukprot:15310742-Alexandrium_andersonii.AAC.1
MGCARRTGLPRRSLREVRLQAPLRHHPTRAGRIARRGSLAVPVRVSAPRLAWAQTAEAPRHTEVGRLPHRSLQRAARQAAPHSLPPSGRSPDLPRMAPQRVGLLAAPASLRFPRRSRRTKTGTAKSVGHQWLSARAAQPAPRYDGPASAGAARVALAAARRPSAPRRSE